MSAQDLDRPSEASPSNPNGIKYWEGVDADVDGMLGGIPSVGGYSAISKVDLQGSRSFLAKLGIGSKNGRRRVANALEAGAGSVVQQPV
jgi:protein N-terminal methyltransferase